MDLDEIWNWETHLARRRAALAGATDAERDELRAEVRAVGQHVERLRELRASLARAPSASRRSTALPSSPSPAPRRPSVDDENARLAILGRRIRDIRSTLASATTATTEAERSLLRAEQSRLELHRERLLEIRAAIAAPYRRP